MLHPLETACLAQIEVAELSPGHPHAGKISACKVDICKYSTANDCILEVRASKDRIAKDSADKFRIRSVRASQELPCLENPLNLTTTKRRKITRGIDQAISYLPKVQKSSKHLERVRLIALVSNLSAVDRSKKRRKFL